MSITDDLRERVAIAEQDAIEAIERAARPTNVEMSEAIHATPHAYRQGSPAIVINGRHNPPGDYAVVFADGTKAVVWHRFGKVLDQYGDDVWRVIVKHFRLPEKDE